MGCLKVREVLEYLREPISNSLKDQDAYVRKSGVLSVAKLYESYPQFVKEERLIEAVQFLLKDSNIMVMTNAL